MKYELVYTARAARDIKTLDEGAFPIFCKYSHLPAGGQLYHKYPALLTLTGLFLSNPINGYKKSGMLLLMKMSSSG